MKNDLFLSWPAVLLIVALIFSVFAWRQSDSLGDFFVERSGRELKKRSRLFAIEASRLLKQNDLKGVQTFFSTEGRATGSRVTLIADDGTVLADSAELPEHMDNHLSRPEIAEALTAFEEGHEYHLVVRHSSTSGHRMIYYAMPLELNGKKFVLRAAASIQEVDLLLGRVRREVLLGALLSALLATGFCWFLYRTITRPIKDLCKASKHIAAGWIDVKLPVPTHGVIRELGDSMSRMAEELKTRIGEISQEKSERDAIFAALSEGVIVLNTSETIIDTNRAARRMLQIKGDPRGRQLCDLLRNEALADFLRHLNEKVENAEAEFTFSFPDVDRQMQVHGCRLQWSEGSARRGLLLVFYDMTRLRKLENFRRDFVANVSHEIKTPLTVIRGAVETLLDGAIDSPDDAKRFMTIIGQHSERLNNLVQDILSLSQLESRALGEGYSPSNCGLSLPLQAAVKFEEPRAVKAGIHIRTEIQEDPEVRIDVQLVEQAIINLIDNAIQHSGEKSEVQIRLYREEDDAVLAVIDHGCGIPTGHIERIFERFYRVDKARSRKEGGTGLGLAIVKHTMQLHHGSASVISIPGKGSTFLLRMPIYKG